MMLACVKTEFVCLHRWKGAPPKKHINSHLANWHRHKFHVTVKVRVDHDDRQVEFLELLSYVEAVCVRWDQGRVELSCEMFCRQIAGHLQQLGYDVAFVSVYEDNENGAEYTP